LFKPNIIVLGFIWINLSIIMVVCCYTQRKLGQKWLGKYRGKRPSFVCVLGFTATGLIEGISAAGKTPEDRKYTALADAEFLSKGIATNYSYPLPPLTAGASPVFISRAVVEHFSLPLYIFNAGLPKSPNVPHIDLGATPAECLTTGKALSLPTVEHLLTEGLKWGKELAETAQGDYLVIGECVVGGTTTALAVLSALGIDAQGKVNSSHPNCNHGQKWEVVQEGLKAASLTVGANPLEIIAAVGDPMQIVVAGMAIAASNSTGVLLAGGTQMLAVYALMRSLMDNLGFTGNLEEVVVGTTRWVAEDSSGDTVGLAEAIGGVCLMATKLDFSGSIHPQLRVYEQGYVKEGVGAGGCAIASHLLGLSSEELVAIIDRLLQEFFNSSIRQT
jgi:uncharacterized protein (TIGR00303 family)